MLCPQPKGRPSVFEKRDVSRERMCIHCAGPMPRYKPSEAAKRVYCSLKCHYAAKKQRNPARKPCIVCGQPCDALRRSPGQRTCSAKCGYERRKARLRVQRQCNKCGVTYWPGMSVRTKFCSARCYAATQAARPAFVTATCLNCRADFRRTRAAVRRSKQTFCGRECSKQFLRGEQHHLYRGDKDPNRGAKWNRLADTIRLRDGYCCRRCGGSQAANGQKLSVDHVRPWRSFTDKVLANHPDNLVALCRGCHSYKTTVVESAWLRGDVLGWKQWVVSLSLQSAVKFGWSA